MTGVELIAAERVRQIEVEGWSAEHDQQHGDEALAWVAMYYAMPYPLRHKCLCGQSSFTTPDSFFEETEWDFQWAKRAGKDRIRQLAVAGALIAAEIDRLHGEEA